MAKGKTKQQTIEELQARLQEMEETLEAIRSGAVDAIVASGPAGDQVFTLEGADHAYHVMVETMNEGAVTVLTDGTILYGNPRFAQMTGASPSGIVGHRFHEFVPYSDHPVLDAIIDQGGYDCPKTEISLRNGSGADIPVQIAPSPIELSDAKALTLVITDLSEQRRYEEIVAAEKLSRLILQQAHEAIAVCIDGCIVRANRALYEICGSFPLMQRFDLVIPLRMSDSEMFSVVMLETGKTIRNQEVRYQRADGKIFDLILSAGPIIGQASKLLGTLISLVDITERKRQAAILEGINRIFQEAISSHTEEQLGQMCLAVIEELTESKMGFIGEIGADGQLYDITISNPGWDACRMTDQEGHRRPSAEFKIHGIYGRVLREGKSFFTNEPSSEPDSIGLPPGHPPLESFLGVPLRRNGRTIGMIGMGNREGGYGQRELETLEGLAPAIVEAFLRKRAEKALLEANASLEQRVRERTRALQILTEQIEKGRDDLRRLASELVMAEEKERKRIAVTLHDEVAQTLAAAKMRLDLLKTSRGSDESRTVIEEAGALLVQSIRETRGLMNNISSPVLYDFGLEAAVQNLAEQMSAIYGLTISHSVSGEFANLEQELTVMIYQAVRELLHNVVKHTQARNVSIRVIAEETGIQTVVSDDGQGFDVNDIGSPGYEGGFGLFSIRERVKSFNGDVQIESTPGKGSVVTVVLPAKLIKEKESRN
jgi:PAS domain S-box-containing protein